ncbi:DNA-3-methyladenine glycosylase I [Lactobacillus sp. ESL0679]|uniref:DNA-3-methyladenine glycosylase I n=1 Tax=Lactobacillus sp. ESL0679 TaxID=2983209 RepID=UPI0023F7F98C|nr:DNA-3-methyladenine glycosylase I [Lactobacillus sp. ESL0679]MDF7682314.1 DNA-3-methyladenine glycosylase I [Lactobacillus sp. ESL0679]
MEEHLRCPWGDSQDNLMQQYHDHEWGKLNLDEQYLYEMLILELFQSGLNWSVVLHKRENFRRAFKNFVPEEVAQMTDEDVATLMQDKSIIRNRQKITAAIKNAKAILIVEAKYGSFGRYLQEFIKTPLIHHPQAMTDIPTTNDVAKQLAKQLKKNGFSFVGPVVIYSYLQGIGLINDHLETCPFKYHG